METGARPGSSSPNYPIVGGIETPALKSEDLREILKVLVIGGIVHWVDDAVTINTWTVA
jgi:hypothetical protein